MTDQVNPQQKKYSRIPSQLAKLINKSLDQGLFG